MRNKTLMILGLSCLLAACGDDAQSQSTTPAYGAMRKLTLRVDYPKVITGAVPDSAESLKLIENFGVGRVYVDDSDIGDYRKNEQIIYDIPANAKTFELKMEDLVLSSTRSASNTLDLTGTGKVSVSVYCRLVITNPDRMDCKLSG